MPLTADEISLIIEALEAITSSAYPEFEALANKLKSLEIEENDRISLEVARPSSKSE